MLTRIEQQRVKNDRHVMYGGCRHYLILEDWAYDSLLEHVGGFIQPDGAILFGAYRCYRAAEIEDPGPMENSLLASPANKEAVITRSSIRKLQESEPRRRK